MWLVHGSDAVLLDELDKPSLVHMRSLSVGLQNGSPPLVPMAHGTVNAVVHAEYRPRETRFPCPREIDLVENGLGILGSREPTRDVAGLEKEFRTPLLESCPISPGAT
jgi:hypothetical protein